MTKKSIAAAAVVASALAISFQAPAQARIVCDGQFQVNSGYPIATPGCADRFLVQVARGYGMSVSVENIGNPGTKQRVCEFIGYDTRVQNICSGWRNDGAGGIRAR